MDKGSLNMGWQFKYGVEGGGGDGRGLGGRGLGGRRESITSFSSFSQLISSSSGLFPPVSSYSFYVLNYYFTIKYKKKNLPLSADFFFAAAFFSNFFFRSSLQSVIFEHTL